MQKKQVKCPQCKKLTEYSATNEFRPFCSERCQLLDLGDWADEKFAIPATVSADIAEDEDDLDKKPVQAIVDLDVGDDEHADEHAGKEKEKSQKE